MATNKLSRGSAAGGLGSNKVVRPGVRTGAAARGTSPKGVSQIGSSMGNHITDRREPATKAVEPVFQGRAAHGGNAPLGNAVALNVGKGGPGTGRDVSRSGSQSCYGPSAQGVNVGSGPSKVTGRSLID
jgi:hypothetical protein